MADDKMTIKQAADALGVSRNTIVNMANRGLLRIIHKPFGNPRLFVLREDVDKLLNQVKESEQTSKRKKITGSQSYD